MTEHPPCADRCTLVADLLADRARAHGTSEAHERLSAGLSREFVPPLPRTPTAAALRWFDEHDSTD